MGGGVAGQGGPGHAGGHTLRERQATAPVQPGSVVEQGMHSLSLPLPGYQKGSEVGLCL